MTEELFRCSRCKQELPRARFSKNAYRHNGVNYYCRPCHATFSSRGSKDTPGAGKQGHTLGRPATSRAKLLAALRNAPVPLSLGVLADLIYDRADAKARMATCQVISRARWLGYKIERVRHDGQYAFRLAQEAA